MAVGVARVFPEATIVLVPMADGGEGTVQVLVDATAGRLIETEVAGPLGGKVKAAWGMLGGGMTAVVEMSAASGITLVPREHLDPLKATTYGTGELIKAALDAGCRRLIIGLGGSATSDGGAGMAQALGARLLDSEGEQIGWGGGTLASLRSIDVSGMDPRLADVEVVGACDVDNPLTGERGASLVFGRQKGATPEVASQLDIALRHYADIVKQVLGVQVDQLPCSGAAGGLGAGLIAFLNARLVPGVDVVSEAVGLDAMLGNSDMVLTGEGSLDAQTAYGKVVWGVGSRARALSRPVCAICGQVVGGEELYRYVDAALSIAPGPMMLEQAMADAARLVADAAERAMRLVRVGLLL
jgi:glycerate kinase